MPDFENNLHKTLMEISFQASIVRLEYDPISKNWLATVEDKNLVTKKFELIPEFPIMEGEGNWFISQQYDTV